MKFSKQKISEYLVLGIFLWFYMSSFINQSFYAETIRYGSLTFFIALVIMFFLLPSPKQEVLSNKLNIACIVSTDLIALLNLFILKSNKGAALIIFDLTLLLFLSDKILLSERIRRIMAFSGAALMIPWYSYVRWDYGFNMVGLVFLLLLIFGCLLLEYVKNDLDLPYLSKVQVLLFVSSLLLTVCYHARSAFLTILFFGIVWLILPSLKGSKAWYTALISMLTIGSIIFTYIYTVISSSLLNIRFLYKDLMSGREGIWRELWEAFFHSPVTGIGSSYELKSFFIFEVHNGLFDILAVHGIVVFILILILLCKRLFKLREVHFEYYPGRRIAAAGVFALLFASFFENCFIVPPYSAAFFALLLLTL